MVDDERRAAALEVRQITDAVSQLVNWNRHAVQHGDEEIRHGRLFRVPDDATRLQGAAAASGED